MVDRTQDSNRTFSKVGFIRLNKVLEIIPVGKSTWWAGVRSGRFPKPVKFGPRITCWRIEDIQKLIEELEELNHV